MTGVPVSIGKFSVDRRGRGAVHRYGRLPATHEVACERAGEIPEDVVETDGIGRRRRGRSSYPRLPAPRKFPASEGCRAHPRPSPVPGKFRPSPVQPVPRSRRPNGGPAAVPASRALPRLPGAAPRALAQRPAAAGL